MTRSKFDKRLGNVLSRRKLVSEDALAGYMETAEKESSSLTSVLLDSELLSEAELLLDSLEEATPGAVAGLLR